MRAIAIWLAAAGIEAGAVFRRVNVRCYEAKAAVQGRAIDSISSSEAWNLRKTLLKLALPAWVEHDV